jgi:NADH:ubiquinone oxidoreductase subunit 5 (subunit L)/multisubunit Na+/H+ antiporter MnhA subunit
MNSFLLLGSIFVPTLGAFLLPLAGKLSCRLRNGLALAFIATPLVFSLTMLPTVLNGQTILVDHQLILGFNFVFMADGLAVFMACVSALISTIVVFYSFGYISHYENQNEYYAMVALFLGAMMGLVFSANLIWLYLFWEITAIASWRLIGFFRGKVDVIRADKAFLVTAFGALAMLLGFVVIYQQSGSFDLVAIQNEFCS